MLSWATSSLTNLVDFKQPAIAGAIDVVVVKQPNGTLSCTPFHVKFPKAQTQNARGRRVRIKVDGREIKLSMKLGQAGEAFFVERTSGPVARELLSSPLPRSEYRKQALELEREESKQGSPDASPTVANPVQRSRSFSATRKPEAAPSKDLHEPDMQTLQQPRFSRRRSQSVGEIDHAEPRSPQPPPQRVEAEPTTHWWSWKWGALPVLKDSTTKEDGHALERVNSTATSDADSREHMRAAYVLPDGCAFSLCADVLATIADDLVTVERVFTDNIVSEESFERVRLTIVDDERLVVCIAGQLVPPKLATGLLLAKNAFQIELTKEVVRERISEYRGQQSVRVPQWVGLELRGEIRAESPDPTVSGNGHDLEQLQVAVPVSSAAATAAAAETVNGMEMESSSYPTSPHTPLKDEYDHGSRLVSTDEDYPAGDITPIGQLRIDVQSDTASEVEEELLVHDIPLDEISPEPARGFDSDTESVTGSLDGETKKYRYRKTLVPSSDLLLGMGLRNGSNEVEFLLDDANTSVSARIYLWPSDAKIVVTDVDGPIVTRSGMLANFIPVKSRYHSGVVELFSNIQRNGYKILYLATKSLGQISSTKGELENVSHKDARLPLGPVFLPPDSLFQTFGEERADVFKSVVLRGVRNLFPHDHNPFFAGFGTKASDMVAFKRVGFPDGRIFIVKEKGQVHNLNRTFNKTYTNLNDLLHEIFPAHADSFSENAPSFYKNRERTEDAYNDINFWRIPPPPLVTTPLRK